MSLKTSNEYFKCRKLELFIRNLSSGARLIFSSITYGLMTQTKKCA